jgi:hypothetical protein
LEIAATDPVTKGKFYDLMYANFDNPGFNPHRQYAFMRKSTHEALLVIVNFDAELQHVSLNVPPEAWEYIRVKSHRRHVTDLITGKWDYYYLDTTKPFESDVPGYGAVVLRISAKG